MNGLRQRFFLATHATPLRNVWRGAYELALRFVTDRLAHTHGVRSVYLRSGLLDEPIYGLADIDLFILVDDDYTKLRVSELLAYLKTLVPMLEAEGVAIHAADRIAEAHARSPRLQYILGLPSRLLFGPDLLAALRPTASPAEQARAALGEAWSVAVEALGPPPGPERAYQWAKILTRVARAVRFARTGELCAERRAVLAALDGEVDPELLAVARDPVRRARPVHLAEAWDAIHALVSAALPHLAPPRPATDPRPLPVLGSAPSPNLFVTDDPRELPCAAPRKVVRAGDRPGPAEVDDLLAATDGAAQLFVERGDVLYPLSRPRLYGLCLRATHPELFDAGRVPDWRWREILDALARRRAAVSAMASDWVKHDDASYARLFVSTLEATGEPPRLFATPSACCEDLTGEDREAAAAVTDWLARSDPRPLPPAAVRASLRLMRRRLGLAEVDGDRPAARASLSVVICTRNRAAYLDRLLGVLAEQTRAPDEVVIVDNGSTDGTAAVIDAWRARLPISDVFLREPGIPRARNAGMRHARGDILVYADDDTVPVPGWLAGIEAAFARDPRIGIVGGDVVQASDQPGAVADFLKMYMGLGTGAGA